MRVGVLREELSISGLIIAGIGFFLTRFTVALTVSNTPMKFLFAGLLPLVLGLGLAAFGVALTVGAYRTRFVRTVALWTLIGTGMMGVLVISTIFGSTGMRPILLSPGPLLSNFLIGGAVGGSMVGMYAARSRDNQEKLRHHANRLATLNRILRDQVLNAVSIIKGHASLLAGSEKSWNASSVDVITDQSEVIENSIEEIGSLTIMETDRTDLQQVDLEGAVEEAIAEVRPEFPDVQFESDLPGPIQVYANDKLDHVIHLLLDNAARYNEAEDPYVVISAEKRAHTVHIRIRDNGPGLPKREQKTLEMGTVTEFDDPRSGFGLNIVRLLVESFGGMIRTEVTDGTTIEIELGRGDQEISFNQTGQGEVGTYGVPNTHLAIGTVGGLLAGAVMGVTMQAMAGIIPVIGALYGVQDPLIGWVTHEFHSVVFAMIFVTLLTGFPHRSKSLKVRLGVALGFATFLWLVAAGIVMPIWLRLLGLDASLPDLTGAALVGHLAWGVTLAIVHHFLRTRLEATDSLPTLQFGPLG